MFRVKLSYGKSNKKENSDGRDFFSLEYYDSGDTYNASELMQMFHVYDYLEEYNFIKIEIIDPAKDDVTLYSLICIGGSMRLHN